MRIHSTLRRILLTGLFAMATTVGATAFTSAAHASVNTCITRTVSATYNSTSWVPQTVCASGEFAVSAAGFCGNGTSATAGSLVGVSTTANTKDRQVWLWCTKPGAAIWYAMCCKP
jgi:hypothetical protein